MTITITIKADNAAFDGKAGPEIYRILNTLAKEYRPLSKADTLDGKKLLDLNGNTVGKVEVSK